MDRRIITFHRLIEQVRPPERADRSALGTLPTRAYRYCDAITTASGFGWWIYPPMDLRLLWDGTDMWWHYDGAADWLPLHQSVQFPGQAARFDTAAPPFLQGCSPPFLTALSEPGTVQIWSGLIARTAPGWASLIRAPANLTPPGGYVHYEGIVETDFWFGPLFTNLRLTRTNVPVHLSADFPLAQVQPLPHASYADETLNAMSVVGAMADLDERDWRDFHATVVVPNDQPNTGPGWYAVAARRRRRGGCPVTGMGARGGG